MRFHRGDPVRVSDTGEEGIVRDLEYAVSGWFYRIRIGKRKLVWYFDGELEPALSAVEQEILNV